MMSDGATDLESVAVPRWARLLIKRAVLPEGYFLEWNGSNETLMLMRKGSAGPPVGVSGVRRVKSRYSIGTPKRYRTGPLPTRAEIALLQLWRRDGHGELRIRGVATLRGECAS